MQSNDCIEKTTTLKRVEFGKTNTKDDSNEWQRVHSTRFGVVLRHYDLRSILCYVFNINPLWGFLIGLHAVEGRD